MATRFYLDSAGTPTLSPTQTAIWDDKVSALRRNANNTKGSSALATQIHNFPGADTNGLAYQFVSAPLAAQTITGTFSLALRCNAVSSTEGLGLIIKVMGSDGITVRGVLFDNFGPPYNLGPIPTTLSSMTTIGQAVASVTALSGDVICIEIGDIVSSGGNSSFRIGESSGFDLGATAGETNDYNPWVEFSQTLTFSGGGGGGGGGGATTF